jgi:hypothetical protein
MQLRRRGIGTICLLLLGLTSACSSASKSSDANSDDNAETGGNGGSSGSEQGGTSTNGGSTQTVNDDLTLTKVSARVVGRLGTDVQIDITATGDPTTIASLQLTLKDKDGNPVEFFDANWDSEKDSATGRLLPTTYPTEKPIQVTGVLKNAGRLSNLSQLEVSLVDNNDAITKSVAADVTPLPKKDLDESCDPTGVKNRCAQGLACDSTSKVCVAGSSPVITKAQYVRNMEGPILRVEGTDPDDDVLLMRLEFFSAQSAPVSIDVDGDGELDANDFETSYGITDTTGKFSFYNQSGLLFDDLVPKFVITATDSVGNESTKVPVTITDPPIRSLEQTCDLSAFDNSCTSGLLCVSRTIATVGRCTKPDTAKSERCNVAQTLTLKNGHAKISGTISGQDVWDTCAATGTKSRPDNVYKLHLAEQASTLTLSTAQPETMIDTIVMLLPSCTAPAEEALGCNDDATGFSSTVSLKDVPAGDYFVIVESRPSAGGAFGLTIDVE